MLVCSHQYPSPGSAALLSVISWLGNTLTSSRPRCQQTHHWQSYPSTHDYLRVSEPAVLMPTMLGPRLPSPASLFPHRIPWSLYNKTSSGLLIEKANSIHVHRLPPQFLSIAHTCMHTDMWLHKCTYVTAHIWQCTGICEPVCVYHHILSGSHLELVLTGFACCPTLSPWMDASHRQEPRREFWMCDPSCGLSSTHACL